jgi:hypothetical protein
MTSVDTNFLPPAGALLIMIDSFAESFELDEKCDMQLRAGLPFQVAYEILRTFSEGDALEIVNDQSSGIYSTVDRLAARHSLFCSDGVSDAVLNKNISNDILRKIMDSTSVVQAMQLVDEFCDRFGINTFGERELKFAMPIDSVFKLIHEMCKNSNFKDHVSRDIAVVSKCRSYRLHQGIDLSRNTFTNLIAVNRSGLVETLRNPVVSKPTHDRTSTSSTLDSPSNIHRFSDSFNLHQKTVLKHSGPALVIALSLDGLENVVHKWLRTNKQAHPDQFLNVYPFDCVARAIKASPTSVSHALWLIRESMKTRGRFQFSSINILRDKLLQVCDKNAVPGCVRDAMISKMSITYAHMIVFKQLKKGDSKNLDLGESITLNSLRHLLKTCVIRPFDDLSCYEGEIYPTSAAIDSTNQTSSSSQVLDYIDV